MDDSTRENCFILTMQSNKFPLSIQKNFLVMIDLLDMFPLNIFCDKLIQCSCLVVRICAKFCVFHFDILCKLIQRQKKIVQMEGHSLLNFHLFPFPTKWKEGVTMLLFFFINFHKPLVLNHHFDFFFR